MSCTELPTDPKNSLMNFMMLSSFFFAERVLLGDVFHAKNDTKTLCFTVISCKILSKIEVLSYFLNNFVRSKPIPI